MAEMLLLDNLERLQIEIHRQHLIYLEACESSEKVGQREKLENYIREYLYVAPHDSKFTFQQTAEVLRRSVTFKNFDSCKAAEALKSIQKYADNLILHPWRPEFRDIRLYTGFFKRDIEGSLVGAELMLEAMGYRHVGDSSMSLPGVIDPDRVTAVSKDAIVAFVECQLMKQIWEALSTQFNISWLEILEFRKNHTGSPEHVVRALTYKNYPRYHQDQPYRGPEQLRTDCSLPHADFFYPSPSPGYYSHPSYVSLPSCSVPSQNRCRSIYTSQHVVPISPVYPSNIHPTFVPPNILKPQDSYPVNGYSLHHHYSSAYSTPHMPQNGYPGVPMMCPAPSVVPTGQLIELESSPTHGKGGGYFQRASKYSPHEESMYQQEVLKYDGPSLTGKAKDDGAGSWETWDFVYRNLESQGYSKDFESLGRIHLRDNQLSSSQNNSSDDIDSIVQTDLSDKVRKLKLSSSSQSKGETSSSKIYADIDEGSKLKNTRERSKVDLDKTKEPPKLKNGSKSVKTTPEKNKKANSSNTVTSRSSLNRQKEIEPPPKEDSSCRISKEEKPSEEELEDGEEKWHCITCTYLNPVSKSVCEMCCKSKDRGSELNPQPRGGQECPKCTLVNEPGISNCAACNFSLKDSPTYI